MVKATSLDKPGRVSSGELLQPPQVGWGVPYRDARRLPLLETVRIASPCDAAWHAMRGDDRVRFCHRCDKHVYNLSAMTRKEADFLLAERQGPLCVSLFKRADGTVITSDSTVRVCNTRGYGGRGSPRWRPAREPRPG